ncbi:MAG: hypothetical protein AAGG44_10490 [Planctomycetota bacterium]
MRRFVFGLFSKKTVVDAAPIIRRIIDVTTPNKPFADDTRGDRRFNRTLPVVVSKLKNDKPDASTAIMALTHDMCDRGLSVVAMEELTDEKYFVSIWPTHETYDEPVTMQCILRNCHAVAHGFWAAGFAVEEVLNIDRSDEIEKITAVASRALRVPQQTQEPEPELAHA